MFYPIIADSEISGRIEIRDEMVRCFEMLVSAVCKRPRKNLVSECSIWPGLDSREKG